MRNKTTLLSTMLALLLVVLLVPLPARAQGPLTQTYTATDGSFTFGLPEGWVVEEFFGTILFANSQETFDSFFESGEIAPGQVYGVFLSPTALSEELGWSEIPADLDLSALLSEYMGEMEEGTLTDIESTTLGGKPVARVTGVIEGEEAVIAAIGLGESGVALMGLVTVPGELAQYEDLLSAMIESIEAGALALPTETGSVVWQQLAEITDDPAATGGFGDVVGLAIGPDDTIYIADAATGVHVYGPDGTPQGVLSTPELSSFLSGFAAAPDGTLWAVDFMGMAYNIDAEGNVLSSFDMSEAFELAFFGTQLVVAPDGNLYFLNSRETDNDRAAGDVYVFAPDGSLVTQFVAGEDDYFYTGMMAFGPDDTLYLAESYTGAGIKTFDPQGNLLDEGFAGGTVFTFAAIAVAPDGSIYAAAPDSPIYHFAPDGTLLGRFGESQLEAVAITEDEDYPPLEPGMFFGIIGMGVLSNGDVVVVDSNYSSVQIVRIAFGE